MRVNSVVFFALLGITAFCHATEDTEFFMRVTRRDGKSTPQTLETAIVTMVSQDGTQRVDLVAAVHIGDKAYYQQLNERFREYDAVLYELVAPEGTVIDAAALESRRSDNPLNMLQGAMGSSLKLAHQLEHVDYTAANFIHADLSPDEFFSRLQERGDIGKLFARALATSMTDAAKKSDSEIQGRLIASLLLKDRSLALKRAFADTLVTQMTTGLWIIGGDSSAIITDRNAACLKVLRRELDGSKDGGKNANKKNVAIFYGGAHLPELRKSLESDFGLTVQGSEWLVAWNMVTPPSPNPNLPK